MPGHFGALDARPCTVFGANAKDRDSLVMPTPERTESEIERSHPPDDASPAPSGVDLVHDACFCGDLALVQRLHGKGYSLTDVDKNGSFPIHSACSGGQLACIQWLALQKGVSLNAADSDGAQPIHYAARRGHLDIIQWLANLKLCLARKAATTIFSRVSSGGWNASAKGGAGKGLRGAIVRVASINRVVSACRTTSTDAVQRTASIGRAPSGGLAEAGAIQRVPSVGKTPLFVPLADMFAQLQLEETVPENLAEIDGAITDLFDAIERDKGECLPLLTTHDHNGMQLIHIASSCGHLLLLQWLARVEFFPRKKQNEKYTQTSAPCNTLQHTATHCNTLQHTATHCNSP